MKIGIFLVSKFLMNCYHKVSFVSTSGSGNILGLDIHIKDWPLFSVALQAPLPMWNF